MLMATNFQGIHIPAVTCFDANNRFNPAVQAQLLEFLLHKQHADGIVACATTGEGVLLADEEYWQVAEFILQHTKQLNSKTRVTLGTSHFDPQVTLKRHQRAISMGFDGALVTYPPYIKPDQHGIKAFFNFLFQQAPQLPIIIYNIWYRTGGIGIQADTMIELAKINNIIGVKDAGVTIEHMHQVLQNTDPKKFIYLMGEDSMYFDCLMHGGHGTISAAAHLVGHELKKMQQCVGDNKLTECRELFDAILPKIKLLFAEPNPAPLRAALELLGIPVGKPRLPLLPASEALRDKLKKTFT